MNNLNALNQLKIKMEKKSKTKKKFNKIAYNLDGKYFLCYCNSINVLENLMEKKIKQKKN